MPIDLTSTLRLSYRTYTPDEIYTPSTRQRSCKGCGTEVIVTIPAGTPKATVEAFDKVFRCQKCRGVK